MDTRRTLVLLLALSAIGLVAHGTIAQPGQDCQPVDDRQVCIQDASAPDTLIINGDNEDLSITIENVGSTNSTAIVMLDVERPDNSTARYQLEEPTLAPGETATVTQPLNATTEGTHLLQVAVVDDQSLQIYETKTLSVEVRTEPAPGLGGPIDRVEIALAALIVALLGIAALAYRTVDR
ncbi:COG1361 family protein [Halapricum hydrolyticum]|uniref:CARDB domain-containing protein n=1 Tax=Halapricum hydrolyticum TaxID=2979991 RepID=A0AAE3IBC1_9EURY|nr:hypothetical protein [Halapricum hydrolyticum]MCU4717141.1 hypothetical protein [Halapricum hydrolyticum]MCU4726068.1 hypothetical protein [Halapricum hydrolyticum]